MVGVCFWIFNIILIINSCFAKVKDCPEVCNCLGSYVDCGSNKLSKIPSNLPNWTNVLTLQNNSIKKLSDVNWKHFSELKELILNKNNIVSIPKDALHYQTQLKVLELNRNKLKVIEALTFKSLDHLTTLKLKRNQINELKDGAFYGLTRIDKLILDYNHLRVISKSWLYGLESLKELSLSHNLINKIDLDAWEFCQTLFILDLSFNNLESIEADTFKNLGQLQKLSLNNNNITYIKENAFVHLPRLKVLNLNNNQISWTIEDTNGVFQGLGDLVKFHLSGNKIKSISADAFVGLKNVTYLNLGNNNITSIQNNAFSEVPLLKDLIINTTSLLCDCNLRWFVDWLNLKQLKLQAAICSYPDGLRGQSVVEVTKNLTCDELPKLRLIEEPDPEIMALKGENITLNCKAISSSPGAMTFLWKKDNIELLNPNVIVKSRTDPDGKSTETSSVLNLIHVEHSHAGKYQCVVSNSFGTTYSQKSAISVLVYPTFIKMPKNVTVRAGETVKLECAANGEPTPEIAWHKDGGNDFPAARERRMQVMPHDDVFFIVNAKPIDMGVYSCTAHNPAGIVVANASLTVQEKPSFIKAMEDKEFAAGEDMVLPCLAKGLPKPTITWLKDGETIVRTERHFFIHEDQLLIIVDSVKTDSGVYECHLNNSLGEKVGQSRIIVKQTTYDTSNMMGIIIITVVCCAVLTSIIWVVIIYQTRKRMSPPVIQTEMQELPDMTETTRAHQLQLHLCPDNISDHSSSKDSGTGDSAKRSNDDLGPEEFTMIINGDVAMEMNNSHVPLLLYPRSTNHDRFVSVEVSASETPPKDV
ncbi:leucine-rich repeats and immunoglobulin-like domains protein 2 isoform X2 [Anoplophora glabripennis]|uniref:leucine-rich repeats and immunoglobulin-like domains protein 2 isoform X2 n=1 Tax=Anoplophora glabripennis TaxID=217634 RepID=UPI00087398F9|nr:leucine-rich repeats and immunoglobulin-like domains protein 2 isoform X2 [Anoplophora glabripennis]